MYDTINILSESDKSWDDAANRALEPLHAQMHVVNVISMNKFKTRDMAGNVRYCVNAQVSFLTH